MRGLRRKRVEEGKGREGKEEEESITNKLRLEVLLATSTSSPAGNVILSRKSILYSNLHLLAGILSPSSRSHRSHRHSLQYKDRYFIASSHFFIQYSLLHLFLFTHSLFYRLLPSPIYQGSLSHFASDLVALADICTQKDRFICIKFPVFILYSFTP